MHAGFVEFAIERGPANPQFASNFRHLPAVMGDREADRRGLDGFQREDISRGIKQRQQTATSLLFPYSERYARDASTGTARIWLYEVQRLTTTR